MTRGDGRMAAFQGLHRVSGLIAQGNGADDRVQREALIDAVPQDIVGGAMGRLIRARPHAAASSG